MSHPDIDLAGIDRAKVDPAALVAAAAPLVGLTLTPERAAAVAAAFALILEVAAPALDQAVPEDAEPAPVFTP